MDIKEILSVIIPVGGAILGFIVAFLVYRSRVPKIEDDIAAIQTNIKDVVHRDDIYDDHGLPIFKPKVECAKETSAIAAGIEDIKDTLDGLGQQIQRDRVVNGGFMSAVKERLDLKFTIPKE